jgi:hypothetical protein
LSWRACHGLPCDVDQQRARMLLNLAGGHHRQRVGGHPRPGDAGGLAHQVAAASGVGIQLHTGNTTRAVMSEQCVRLLPSSG